MKKALSFVILTALLFAFLSCFAVSAESGFRITVTVSEDTLHVISGETFDVTFSVTDITEENGLAGVCFAVEYDNSAIEATFIRSDFPDEWNEAEEFNEIVKNEEGLPVGRLVLGASAEGCIPLKKDGYSVTVTFRCMKDGETKLTVDSSDEVFCGVTIKDGVPYEVSGDGCEKELKLEKSKAADDSGNGEKSKTESGGGIKYIIIGACAVIAVSAVAAFIIIKKKKR